MRRTKEERARDIEREARAVLGWHDEFVGKVLDTRGNDLSASGSGEWPDILSDLRKALEPVPDDNDQLLWELNQENQDA